MKQIKILPIAHYQSYMYRQHRSKYNCHFALPTNIQRMIYKKIHVYLAVGQLPQITVIWGIHGLPSFWLLVDVIWASWGRPTPTFFGLDIFKFSKHNCILECMHVESLLVLNLTLIVLNFRPITSNCFLMSSLDSPKF